jgi:hypothetical protein
MKSKEFFYEPPMIEVIEVEVEGGFAASGYGFDSDDSEFGAPAQRRGEWGDLW